MLDAPIPGQSLTREVGSRPYQQPPMYNTVEEALEWYLPKLGNPRFVPGIIESMELGIPLTTMANTLQLGGVMRGIHSIDVGILISPVIIEMLAYLADSAGIEYVSGLEEEPEEAGYRPTTIALAKRKLAKELEGVDLEDLNTSEEQMESEDVESDMDQPPMQQPQGGLMGRR